MASSLQIPAPRAANSARQRWWMAPLLLAVVFYLVLSLWLAHTKAPWYDEGQYSNSAYNLAFHGRMGSHVVESSGFYLNVYYRGVQQRTYFELPNHILALAGWFQMFGFSAFSARAYSISWGVLTLVVLFFILQRLFPDRRIATLVTLFTVIDFIF